MKTRRRKPIVSNVLYGTPTAGRCSVCQRPFEVEIGKSEPLNHANERLVALFERHARNEDANQAGAEVAGEAKPNAFANDRNDVVTDLTGLFDAVSVQFDTVSDR